jgi:hypothetical protein
MCIECWEEYGRPAIVAPAVETAADAVNDMYVIHPVGGALHIVTDDWNLEDEFLDWCASCENLECHGKKRLNAWEQRAFDTLRLLTINERATALALAHGYLDGRPR